MNNLDNIKKKKIFMDLEDIMNIRYLRELKKEKTKLIICAILS